MWLLKDNSALSNKMVQVSGSRQLLVVSDLSEEAFAVDDNSASSKIFRQPEMMGRVIE
jgi:hypothetical protein